ncbi:MAG TPA: nucleotide exchange factor GrpE [Candidatus Fournierella pullicola]|uniref:Protein GrpE n=1 Tax=Candidatus Allofournierella pullicola TaxID=2838596 RepID=A0A9D1V2X0_9FIRM|nr:nucleotide exchange factor GrpE [Candidatus Fournierella pullicola]
MDETNIRPEEAAAAQTPAPKAEEAQEAAAPKAEKAPEKEKDKKEKKKELESQLAAAKAEAEKAKAEAAEAKDRLLRTAAEYDNFRKRSAREQDAAFGNGVAHAVSQILTILDTLEMAEAAPTADENFKKGVTLTLEKAKAAFEALKVEEIPALGLPFDPAVHNAVMQKAAENGEESGTVLQVFQKGYKLGDKVIRHATVIVAE